MKNEKWFSLETEEIEKKLNTNAAAGLSLKAARSRGARRSGDLFCIPRRSPWRILGDIVLDFALILLLLGAFFSLFFDSSEVIRGVTVFVTVVVYVTVWAIMHYRDRRMMESISSFYYPMAKVIRSGRLFHMDFRSVVVGDVIIVEKGDIICCDARIVNADRLRVNMRVDKKTFVSLEKSSEMNIPSNENDPRKMSNMLHAGSIVENGSARAIVTSVGRYTYLGALTGGIKVPISDKSPKMLEKMRKHFSKINFAFLLAVIPFCVISFVLEKIIVGSDSVLSVTFMAALALAATTLSQLTCVMFKLYYSAKIRQLFTGRDAAVIRSVDTFDKLSGADYVFMMDGCAVTDGLLHFDTVLSSEGELRNFSSFNGTYKIIAEYAHLYRVAATRALTTGISGAGIYYDGIDEFVKKMGIDTEALKYRCTVMSYSPANMYDRPERIFFRDGDRRMYLNVSSYSNVLRSCKYAMYGGDYKSMSLEGIKALEKSFSEIRIQGRHPIILTLSSENSMDDGLCFVGMLVFKEGIDRNAAENIRNIERFGCKVISFVDCEACYPSIPAFAIGGRGSSREDFIRNRLSLTYNFGSINTYSDLRVDEVKMLIAHAHSLNKKVLIMGFSDTAMELSEYADGFITCSEINPKISGYFNQEIKSSELAGERGSSSCTQIIKDGADCLITRPGKRGGGLSSLAAIVRSMRSVACNVSDSIRYMISVNIITLLMVILPLFLGNAVLDARHIVIGAFILNTFAFFAFMKRNNSYISSRSKNYCEASEIKDYFRGDLDMLVSSIASGACAVFLPKMLDVIIGEFDYPTEIFFTELLVLYVTAFVMVFYNGDYGKIRFAYKNITFIFMLIFVVFLWGMCVAYPDFGAMLGIEGFMGIAYFLCSFVPALVYIIIFMIFRSRRRVNF